MHKQKLLIIETITWKPHVETAIEIALTHLKSGGTVDYHNLRKGLPYSEDQSASHLFFDLPSLRIKNSHNLSIDFSRFNHHVSNFSFAERRSARITADELLRTIYTTEDFLGVCYREFSDIGWGALSSAISLKRDSSIGLQNNRKLLRELVASSILVYDKTREIISQEKPDSVVVFNGRFASTLAALRAAEHSQIPWLIHERGCDKDHYFLSDFRPHDMDAKQNEMRENWRPEHAEFAHKFYRGRRERTEKDWHSFTKYQEKGKIPREVANEGEWITLFTSSEDEMVAIGSNFRSEAFPSQFDAIHALAGAIEKIPNLKLCIRVHPHTMKKSRRERQKWRELCVPSALIISPEDNIDSYALLEKSKAIASCGSTIGIEATYWRRPSLLIGRSFYDKLDAVTIAKNSDEIYEFCNEPKIKPIEGALLYGAYLHTFGIPYEFYQADNFHSGRILGTNLDQSLSMNLARNFYKKVLHVFTR